MNEIVKKETYKLMEDEEERDTYYLARNYMKSKGYNQYEISNFAKKGYESKHNLKYWDRAEYIGIGASAHSFLENKRYSNVSNVDEYIKSINSCILPIDYEEYINKEDALWEFLILGLRKSEGVNIEEMETKFNTSFSKYREIIKELNDDGLLIRTKENIKLTKKGMDLSNYVFVKLK
jgi:oxygen-independent coproporphyrinogen-3 oxidase